MSGLKVNIDLLTALVYRSPMVALLAVGFHNSFINVEDVTTSPEFSFQSAGINIAELETPKTDRFSSEDDASIRQQIFDLAMTEVELEVTPDGIANDIR